MKRLLIVSCLLFMSSCAEPDAPVSEQEEPLPEYVQPVQGDGYQGVIFTVGRAVVPGYEDRGITDLGSNARLPTGASFRRATESEVAAFEARLPTFWERSTGECANGDCPFAYTPGSVHMLSGWRRQYVGYTDSTGGRGLWVNFYPTEYHNHPPPLKGPYSDWVLMPTPVEDGGPVFFNLYYSVDRDSVLAIWFNGHA